MALDVVNTRLSHLPQPYSQACAMIYPLLLLIAAGFQNAPARPVPPDSSPEVPAVTAPATPVPGAPAPGVAATTAGSIAAQQALDQGELSKSNALKKFRALQFRDLKPEEWTFIGVYYGARALFVVILMTLAWTISSWSSSAVRTALRRVKFDETLAIFLAKLVRWAILLLVAMTCLSYFGVETTGFAAVIGAAGLAIGLAFQGTLSNFAAGAMLLIFRPYKVGDIVNVAGYMGTVREVELFTTDIDTFDNRRIIVPNSSIFGSVIENITYHPVRRADINVGAAYSADLDETRRVLERAAKTCSLILPDPAPVVMLLELGASSVNWQVRGFAKRDTFGDAKQQLIRAIKVELDHAGIGIPFPQMDVHFDRPPQGDRAA
jgi:small conductance mechanosensitive channel